MGRKEDGEYGEDETARRRDEVIRRMANTPPQPRVNQPTKTRKKSVGRKTRAQKPGAQKD